MARIDPHQLLDDLLSSIEAGDGVEAAIAARELAHWIGGGGAAPAVLSTLVRALREASQDSQRMAEANCRRAMVPASITDRIHREDDDG